MILLIDTGDYMPDEEHENDDSDGTYNSDDEMDVDEQGTKEMNFVNLADRPCAIRCSVAPHKLITYYVSGRLSGDGSKEISAGAIYQQACEVGDLETIRFVFELIKQYPEDDVEEQLTTTGTNAMCSILKGDYPEALDEVIRHTGLGIGRETLTSKSTSEADHDDDGKLYLGLTVKGTKRKDLAQHGSNQNNYGNSFEIPLLWHAIQRNAGKIVEYLHGPKPLEAYQAFSKSANTTVAMKLRKMKDLDQQLPALLGLVPNIRRETALTAAIVGTPKTESLEMVKKLFGIQPSKVKDYVQTR